MRQFAMKNDTRRHVSCVTYVRKAQLWLASKICWALGMMVSARDCNKKTQNHKRYARWDSLIIKKRTTILASKVCWCLAAIDATRRCNRKHATSKVCEGSWTRREQCATLFGIQNRLCFGCGCAYTRMSKTQQRKKVCKVVGSTMWEMHNCIWDSISFECRLWLWLSEIAMKIQTSIGSPMWEADNVFLASKIFQGLAKLHLWNSRDDGCAKLEQK